MADPIVPHRPLIVLFAKAPVAGQVKTRLLRALSPDQAAGLHTAMVRDTLEMLQGLQHIADLELHTDLPTGEWAEFSYPRRLQPDGGLGRRLWTTMDRALGEGRPMVLILGSDSPGLPPSHVAGLLNSSADVKIGPTEDGGFYGIAAMRVVSEMFEGVRWSTSHTLSDTRTALERVGLSVEIGERWFDVDEPVDLLRGRSAQLVGRNTSAWFNHPEVALRLERAATDTCLPESAVPVQLRNCSEDLHSGSHSAD